MSKGTFTTEIRSIISRSNQNVALRLTIVFGSIWCVYAFAMLSLIPLLLPTAQNTLLYFSNSIQLVSLPALMVGSALLARSNEQRAAQDHAALVEILAEVQEELAILKDLSSHLRHESEDRLRDRDG